MVGIICTLIDIGITDLQKSAPLSMLLFGRWCGGGFLQPKNLVTLAQNRNESTITFELKLNAAVRQGIVINGSPGFRILTQSQGTVMFGRRCGGGILQPKNLVFVVGPPKGGVATQKLSCCQFAAGKNASCCLVGPFRNLKQE